MSTKEKTTNQEKEERVKEKISKEEVIGILLVVVFTFLFTRYVIQMVRVNGESMYPNYCHGDHVLIDKVTLNLKEFERNEVVVLKNNNTRNKFLFKRIIGLPNETVQIKNGLVYINDEPIEDPFKREEMLDAGIAENKITLGEDEYFVLGDNRNNSNDSRYFGTIKKDDIYGRELLRLFFR